MKAAWDEIPEDLDDMRRRTLFEVFTPAAPVNRREVFAGRVDQLQALRESMWQKGQHAVIYGERGVGKTSLAKVARELAIGERMFSAHVTCDSGDVYDSIWRKIFAELVIDSEPGSDVRSALDYLPDEVVVDPNTVRVLLQKLTAAHPAVVFIDEFDVVAAPPTRRAMAETIKVLSDQGVNATVVLVGVAESVTGLIDEHASTERNLVQVPMPRLNLDERLQIILRGLESAHMTINQEAADRIAMLSQGLAQFVHLLTQRAAIVCLNRERDAVEVADVEAAIDTSLTDIHVSVTSSYYEAVKSNRETLYPSVLMACALAEPDERGFFSAKSLVVPISHVVGRELQIPAFGPHLLRLATERGPVLEKEGEKRKFRYRFKNPLMQPFVLMRGVRDGLIEFDDLKKWMSPESGTGHS